MMMMMTHRTCQHHLMLLNFPENTTRLSSTCHCTFLTLTIYLSVPTSP